jgi:hypothetical protein
MRNRIFKITASVALLATAFIVPPSQQSVKAAQNASALLKLEPLGTSSFSTAGVATDPSVSDDYVRGGDREVNRLIPAQSNAPARVPADHVPTPASIGIASTNPGLSGFNGLTHRDQRLAGTGSYANTQFSLEPPDQAACVGNGYVLEAVNTAMRVRNASTGASLTPAVALNQFFGLAPEVIRSTPPVFGDFTSDPKCYYDADVQRFFLTLLQLGVNPSTGEFTGASSLLIAVSQTSNPAVGLWNIYRLNTTNDGTNGTPSHPGCPCFGDQPLIGADANGFYVTTNEFPVFVAGFNGAQVYAMSKLRLASGSAPNVVMFGGPIALAEGVAYSIQPATAPPGGRAETAAGGTEYFLSALEFTGGLDDRIAVWALTNTSSLNTASPNLRLSNVVVTSEVYGLPLPAAEQEDGPTTLRGPKDKLEFLDTNDDRMNQVAFAGGQLYGAVNTVVKTENGPARAGIAYFVVTPQVSRGGVLSASMFNQGYISVNGEHVMFPSIAVNTSGIGAIAFSISSLMRFPSTAYVTIDPNGAIGAVHIAAAGVGPEDGFTGYGGSRVARWGDYSAAAVDESGRIWMAAEYIPGGLRTAFANWGTYIARLVP